jgi:hypothetical protein
MLTASLRELDPKKFLNKRDKPDISPIAFASAVRGVGGF